MIRIHRFRHRFHAGGAAKLNVRCVPMTIAFGGDTYTDGVDLPQEIFWQHGSRADAQDLPALAGCLSSRI
ncbi:MAG: hypothetical protein ACLTV6_04250 [Christensenellales bacterium]